jgi:hypothetical protein
MLSFLKGLLYILLSERYTLRKSKSIKEVSFFH